MIKRSVLRISQEVKQAIHEKKPIVALESTIITHGLPYPQNVQMARSVEQVLRESGVVPATCAFVKGVPCVGIDNFEQLTDAVKVSRRDIGYVMANRLNGGTTIALTMIMSHLAGIKVFATGGLGGVHRDGQYTMDVSADLTELGRTPVSVVCAGPKSILDIGLTMEYLETQGVFVGTYNEDKKDKVEIPGFYCRESGVPSPYAFNSFAEAARIIYNQGMMVDSGSIFCIPPPKETALESGFISEIINVANETAKANGIKGKELTPFLLSMIARATEGRSVDCNISLVKNNAKAAAEIAKNLNELECGKEVVDEEKVVTAPAIPSVLVVGSVALDTVAKLSPGSKLRDSNIGEVRNSIGGVGYNVAQASKHVCESTKFRSRIGDDPAGKAIAEKVPGLEVVGGGARTAQYMCTHDASGELLVACADMSIIEQDFDIKDKAKIAVYDCNLSPQTVSKALSNNEYNIIEPTSHMKARRISQMGLNVFPNNQVKLITPTVEELESIYDSFSEKFDEKWFDVLDSLKVDQLRDRLDRKLHERGVFQRCFQLLPFFQNILVKMGEDGVLLVSLCSSVEDYKSIPTSSPYRPMYIQSSFGMKHDGGRLGVVVEYFPIPHENENLEIVNVTGAGDTFLGYLCGKLGENNWLDHEIKSVEQVWGKWETIYKAQLAAGLSLQSEEAVNKNIAHL